MGGRRVIMMMTGVGFSSGQTGGTLRISVSGMTGFTTVSGMTIRLVLHGSISPLQCFCSTLLYTFIQCHNTNNCNRESSARHNTQTGPQPGQPAGAALHLLDPSPGLPSQSDRHSRDCFTPELGNSFKQKNWLLAFGNYYERVYIL